MWNFLRYLCFVSFLFVLYFHTIYLWSIKLHMYIYFCTISGAIPPYQDERTFHKKLGIYLPLDDQRFKKHQSVVSAKLKLFKLRVLRTKQDNYVTNGNFIRVNVYQLLEPARDDDRGTLERLVDSKPVGLVNGEWETFDIEPAVRTWLDSPQRNYGLVIRSESEDLSDYLQFALSNRTDSREIQHIVQENDLMPTLNILTQERVLSRNPRSVNGRDGTTCDEQDGHRLCCRYPLYVSFNEIGWSDWIIEPEGYDAFVCLGACPYKYKLANNHAGVVSSRHMINPMAAPQPCCRGTKLKPLNLLYVDREHGVEINTVIEDMIIEECRCA